MARHGSWQLRPGRGLGVRGTEGFLVRAPLKVLVVDIGGIGVKILTTAQKERRRFPSGKTMTPRKMVAGVEKHAKDWK